MTQNKLTTNKGLLDKTAYFHEKLGEFVLPYEAVRTADATAETPLSFLQTTYDGVAILANWDRTLLERPQPASCFTSAPQQGRAPWPTVLDPENKQKARTNIKRKRYYCLSFSKAMAGLMTAIAWCKLAPVSSR